jgi:hypothetical protein
VGVIYWFGWPDAVGAALGALVIYPLLAWKYGPVRVTDALMFQPRASPPGPFQRIGLALYGMAIAGVFGMLVFGLILRVIAYGLDPTIGSQYVPMAGRIGGARPGSWS